MFPTRLPQRRWLALAAVALLVACDRANCDADPSGQAAAAQRAVKQRLAAGGLLVERHAGPAVAIGDGWVVPVLDRGGTPVALVQVGRDGRKLQEWPIAPR